MLILWQIVLKFQWNSYIWRMNKDHLIMKAISILLAGLSLILATSCNQPAQEDTNAVIDNIMTRRSIRKYKTMPVGRDTLNMIMECGINAPNGQNRQSWEVRIVDNPELLAQMSEAMGAAHGDFAKGCFRGAPVMVFIARDPSYDFSPYDCGLMAENIMLSAWSLGVGSIALGSPVRFLTDNDICRPYIERLGFSQGYELCLCVGLGYADESPEAKPRDMGKVAFVE
jgi:nitroreductase